MVRLATVVKNYTRPDLGSMNNRIFIYDRDIQVPLQNEVNFTEKFTPKLNCWALIETVKGISMFDHSNVERVVTHRFFIRNIPYAQSIESPIFYGTGLNDISLSGVFSNSFQVKFKIQIDSIGATDTFKYSIDNGSTWIATHVAMTLLPQNLLYGISVLFAHKTGHILNDSWSITVNPGVRISSQDWIYYQNQFMGQQSIYDILNVDSLNEENRFLVLYVALTGDNGYAANYA
jgi:hypothetical protein